jgi:putative redox protein
MKVKVKQKADFHFVGTGEDYTAELPIDAAAHVGGHGRGFRPPGLLMYSVASCMGIHTYHELRNAGKDAESVEVSTSGERRESSPKVFTKITLDMQIKAKDLTDADIQDAIRIALTKSCSIAVMVNMVAPITCEYEVTGGPTTLKGAVTAPPAEL